MEKQAVAVWLQLVLAAVFFQTGYCIKCYSCSSLTESKCADPMHSDMQYIECSQDLVSGTLSQIHRIVSYVPTNVDNSQDFNLNQFNCIKFDAQPRVINGNKTTIRGCVSAKSERYDPCADIRKKLVDANAVQFCEQCSTEYCNGSSLTRVSLLSIFISSLVGILAFKI